MCVSLSLSVYVYLLQFLHVYIYVYKWVHEYVCVRLIKGILDYGQMPMGQQEVVQHSKPTAQVASLSLCSSLLCFSAITRLGLGKRLEKMSQTHPSIHSSIHVASIHLLFHPLMRLCSADFNETLNYGIKLN